MVAALKEMKITKKFRDIVLQNAVVNASYAASIESELPDEAAFQSIGGGNIGEGIVGFAEAYLGAISEYVGSSKHMMIDGVKIPHLFPGTKLQLRNAGTAGGIGTGFEQSLLRYIAANLGVSYEELSKDYSQTNYSSIRASGAVTQRFMSARKRMVADRVASAVYRLWLEEAINAGEITTYRPAKNFYEAMNADAYCRCEWIGAGRGQIDELKETQAAVLRLKYHLTTYEDEMARLGKDWRATLAQREREVKILKERGLEVEEANAINAASGAPREAGGEGDNPEKRANEKASFDVSMDVSGMAEVFSEAIGATVKTNKDTMNAIVALLDDREPPTFNVSVEPHIALDVHSKNGRTITRVKEMSEKGHILETETIPQEDDD
jgi:capsid protein